MEAGWGFCSRAEVCAKLILWHPSQYSVTCQHKTVLSVFDLQITVWELFYSTGSYWQNEFTLDISDDRKKKLNISLYTPWRHRGEVGVKLQLFFSSTLYGVKWSYLPTGRCTPSIGDWVRPTASVDVLEERTIFFPFWVIELQISQDVAQLPYICGNL
jgi:hypothetical protein